MKKEEATNKTIGICGHGKSTLVYAITNVLIKEGYKNAFRDIASTDKNDTK